MQRIDVRCAALDSVCTQAVLVMGFALVLLAPDVLDVLRGREDGEESWYDVLFAMLCVVSTAVCFGASCFAVYASLYVGYKAQFAALQGKTAESVSISLDIVLRTNEKVIMAFNVSLASLALSVVLMALAHTHLVVFVALGLTFAGVGWITLGFRRQMDARFVMIGETVSGLGFGEDVHDEHEPAGVSILNSMSRPPDMHEMGDMWRRGHRTSISPHEGHSHAHGHSSLMGALRAPGSSAARKAGRAYKTLREQPSMADVQQASKGLPIAFRGWLRKSPSRLGPLNTRHMDADTAKSSAQDKRFFVLQGTFLKWYNSEDDATLTVSARNAVDLAEYDLVPLGGDFVFALTPRADSSAKKGWYFRASDRKFYDGWLAVLEHATTCDDCHPHGDLTSIAETEHQHVRSSTRG